MKRPRLYWLVQDKDLRKRLSDLAKAGVTDRSWTDLVEIAGTQLDLISTEGVDKLRTRLFGSSPPKELATRPIRLALLGSSTLTHLHASIRVAGLRRGLWIDIYETAYGQYQQELQDSGSQLHTFKPTAALLALDNVHIAGRITPETNAAAAEQQIAAALARIQECWRIARNAFGATVIQQAVLPAPPPLLGNNEHNLPGSRRRFIAQFNERLRQTAEGEGVDILSIDSVAAQDGVLNWHDPALWCRSKQEISPEAAPSYGDIVARILAAQQGRSAKCLVLDLDNTLWGGVIGDDGLEGIVLGQGSAVGEGFVAVQSYAKDLSKRGVILAVVSKNDEENALLPFGGHPEMVLGRGDIACFIANWQDKASNIRTVAQKLNIGLDSLVFLDDNPFERNLVRQELPMVAVPEFPEDAAFVPNMLADAGYFEGLRITDEDQQRTQLYVANAEREALLSQSTDLASYLRNLEMKLLWSHFDAVGRSRTVQLINKTNQFNLTTKRYSDADIQSVMSDSNAFGLQLRLVDRYGDNGIIAIVIGKLTKARTVEIDTWLMSCRVLGRKVEDATLNLIVENAKRLGAARLIGTYRPTPKNGMVRHHYEKLGFVPKNPMEDGSEVSELDLAAYRPVEVPMEISEVGT